MPISKSVQIENVTTAQRSSEWQGTLYGIGAAAIWGGMYVVSDVVLRVVPPFTLLTLRLLIAAGVLGLLLWQTNLRRVRSGGWALPTPSRAQLPTLLGIGLLGYGVSVGAQFVGTDLSTAVNGTLITSASPAFILVFAALLLRERLTARQIAAVVLATAGVLVIIDLANANFSSATFVGDMALAVAALTWGLYSVVVRRVSGQYDTLTVTFYAMLGGLLLTVPAAAVELQSRAIGVIDLPILLGILYLGVVSTAAAMWMWNRAFALLAAGVASLCFFAQPLVGAFLSVLLLNQPMTPNLWIGSLLIGAGVLLALLKIRT